MKTYIAIISAIFLAIAVVFNFLPRTKYSVLEKRDLKTFPEYSLDKLSNGTFTKEISEWFSDSEPYRDLLMSLSMSIKDYQRLVTDEDNITFHAAEGPTPEELEAQRKAEEEARERTPNRTAKEYENKLTANENAKIAHAGIIVVGSGEKVRAMMAYGGEAGGGMQFANIVNLYKQTFGDKVNIYCMVVPIAIDFYCPDKVKKRTKPQLPTINNIYTHLDEDVKAVDVYTTLGKHAGEDIYLRTDHHWTPLGAYYAARRFAKIADVPFRDLSSYEKNVIHGFVGTMYGYSKDIAVKKAPEDFVYYKPKGVDYQTTFVTYILDKDYNITAESQPKQDEFFKKYKDGSSSAYFTFMGGDQLLVKVKTSTNNHRRLMLIKDSFGNALPAFLFYSFEEIHVVDFRYFNQNIQKYVSDNNITDILFEQNIFNAYSPSIYKRLEKFLNQ